MNKHFLLSLVAFGALLGLAMPTSAQPVELPGLAVVDVPESPELQVDPFGFSSLPALGNDPFATQAAAIILLPALDNAGPLPIADAAVTAMELNAGPKSSCFIESWRTTTCKQTHLGMLRRVSWYYTEPAIGWDSGYVWRQDTSASSDVVSMWSCDPIPTCERVGGSGTYDYGKKQVFEAAPDGRSSARGQVGFEVEQA